MMIADFQKAVFEALAADAALTALTGGEIRIFDAMPAKRRFPLVVIGEIQATDWQTDDLSGEAIQLTLRCWSERESRIEIQSIAERIVAVVQTIAPAKAGATRITLVHVLSTTTERDVANGANRATIRLRALCEPDTN